MKHELKLDIKFNSRVNTEVSKEKIEYLEKALCTDLSEDDRFEYLQKLMPDESESVQIDFLNNISDFANTRFFTRSENGKVYLKYIQVEKSSGKFNDCETFAYLFSKAIVRGSVKSLWKMVEV